MTLGLLGLELMGLDSVGLDPAAWGFSSQVQAAEPVPSATTDALEQRLAQLKSNQPDQVLEAVRALGRLGDVKAFRPLVQLLDTSTDERIRAAGLASLEKLRYNTAFLLEVLQNPKEKTLARSYAAYTLGLMQAVDAVPALVECLQSPDETLRMRSIDALGRIKDPRAWKPLLLAANKDPSPSLRRKAQKTVEGLTSQGGARPEDAESLTAQLKDPEVTRRREAAQALNTRGNWWSIRPLIEALKDSDAEVRRYAARALGDLQDRRAVQPLLEFLPRAKGIERYTALGALMVLKDESSVEALLPYLKDPDPETRRLTARALGTLGERRAGPALTQALSDLIPINRREVARALGLIHETGAISRLATMVKDDVEENQIEATRAIGRIGGLEAMGPLGRILTHENAMIVVAGVIAVKETGRVEGLALLEPLARRHKDPLVREEALEAYTELKGKLEREKNPTAPLPDERPDER
ncbi:MAG: HEAT repeat domain-containing protein [Myxococcota bacterium]